MRWVVGAVLVGVAVIAWSLAELGLAWTLVALWLSPLATVPVLAIWSLLGRRPAGAPEPVPT
jgi:hypothetical protein